MKPHPWADLPNFGIKPTSLHQRMVLFWARSNAMRVGQEASKCMRCIKRGKNERLHKSRRWAVTFESRPVPAASGVFRCFVTSLPPSFPPSKRRPQHHISQTKRPGFEFCKGWQPHFFTRKYFTAPTLTLLRANYVQPNKTWHYSPI